MEDFSQQVQIVRYTEVVGDCVRFAVETVCVRDVRGCQFRRGGDLVLDIRNDTRS